jgi:hypothetical protein
VVPAVGSFQVQINAPQGKQSTDAPEGRLPWRVDFRAEQALPDTKPVRTSFMVNGAAFTLVLVLFTFIGTQEFQIYRLRREFDELQQQIDKGRSSGTAAIGLFRKFQTQVANLREIGVFRNAKPSLSSLVRHFGATVPADIVFDGLEMRPTSLGINFSALGDPTEATAAASAYVEALKSDEFIKARFSEVNLINVTRNPTSNRLTVELLLKFRVGIPQSKPVASPLAK